MATEMEQLPGSRTVDEARDLLRATGEAAENLDSLKRLSDGAAAAMRTAAAAATRTARATARAAASAARYAASFDELERLPAIRQESDSSGGRESGGSGGKLTVQGVAGLTAAVQALRQAIGMMWSQFVARLTPAVAAWLSAWTQIQQAVNAAWTMIRPVFEAIRQVWEWVMNGLQNAWTVFGQPVLTAIQSGLQLLWESVLLPLGEQVTGLIATLAGQVMNFWTNVLQAFWTWISTVLAPLWTTLMTGAATAVQGAAMVMQNAVGTAQQAFSGVLEFVRNVFAGNWAAAWATVQNTLRNVWDGIQNTVRGAVNVVIGLVNSMIQAITAGVNGAIGMLNRLQLTVPDWVPLLGGKQFGFSLNPVTAPQIPYLASGGVIRQPTLAMMGEYAGASSDPEIAAPQSAIAQAVSDANGDVVDAVLTAAQQIIDAIRENGGGVVIGDEVIGRAVRRYNSRQAVITGGVTY